MKNVVKSSGNKFYSPGSLLRVTVDTTRPLAFGSPKNAIVFSSGGEAFTITLAPAYNRGDREVRPVVSFAAKDLLASGWVSAEKSKSIASMRCSKPGTEKRARDPVRIPSPVPGTVLRRV